MMRPSVPSIFWLRSVNNKFYIYALLTVSNVPFYVGKTSNLKRRMQEHRYITVKSKRYTRYPVYRKLRKMERAEGYKLKYALLDFAGTLEEADKDEIVWIKEFRDAGVKLYNLTDGGEGTYGHKAVFTKEWRTKLRAAARIRSLTNNAFKGKHHSAKTKRLLSQQRKGKMVGEDNPFYGKHHSTETKRLISESNKGKLAGVPKSALHRLRIGLAHKGRKLSLVHTAKNRDRKGRQDPRVKSIKAVLPDGRSFVCIDGARPLSIYLKTFGIGISQVSILDIANRKTKQTKTGCIFEFVKRPVTQTVSIIGG